MPPVRAMNRWMDLVEHPTAAAALAKASPSETRRWISTWSPWLNRLPWFARRRCISPPPEPVARIIAEMLRRSLETAPDLGVHRGDHQCRFRWKYIQCSVFLDDSLKGSVFVYHFLPWPYAKAILEKKALRLSPVKTWDDPYEQWWCDHLFKRDNLSTTNAYGICWTTNKSAEPHWRMAAFGRSDTIVRIRCNIRTILEAGKKSADLAKGELYVGRIRYCRTDKIEKLANSNLGVPRDTKQRTAAIMLLHKRNAFNFENEVRLLWLDEGVSADEMFIDIDPVKTISQVMTSPYAKWKEHMAIKKYVEKTRH